MVISTSKNECGTDPEKILANMLAQTSFHGVPVVFLDIDSYKVDGTRYLTNCVGHRPELKPLYEFLQENASGLAERIENETAEGKIAPFVVRILGPSWQPAHERGPTDYVPVTAGGIFLSSSYDVDAAMDCCFGFTRNLEEPLLRDSTAYILKDIFHELAHCLGAGEAQADKMSAYFCRRAMPSSTVTAIQADLRAMQTILCAATLSNGSSSDENTPQIYHYLKEYGWATVLAADEALAVPQKQIMAMTDDDIIACRFEKYDHDLHAVKAFGKIANQFRLRTVLAPCAEHVAKNAMKLLYAVNDTSQHSLFRPMAHRFALAAHRLAQGESAYRQPYALAAKLALEHTFI